MRLIKAGCFCWLSLLGLGAATYLLHRFGIVNAWQLPLKPVAAFLIGAGLVCWLVAGLAALRSRRRFLQLALGLVVAVNAIAGLFAYALTHVRSPGQSGIGIPKPQNAKQPGDAGLSYTTHRIPVADNEWLEAWQVPAQGTAPQGTILLFPGHLGTKGSQLLSTARSFSQLGYDAFMVDFRGVGGSSGNTITLGMGEAKDVAAAVDYVQQQNPQSPIVLYGVSMGSAAILRAIALEQVQPDAIILELPFARMVDAVKSRLRYAKIPPSPTAELLVFWGGLQHGFNGLAHNPVTYAKAVRCPVLLVHGQQDPWTSDAEIEEIFANLPEPKQLVVSPEAGHHQLIGVDGQQWQRSIRQFLASI